MSETIAVIGIGRMGLCFALNMERSGYRVVGVDANADYVRAINEKNIDSPEPQVRELLMQAKQFAATTDAASALADAGVVFIAVPTPTSEQGYDHAHLDLVIEKIIALGRQDTRKHLVVSCTTIPGYCDKLAAQVELANYSLSYNPEFIAQGSIIQNQLYPDQVLIGEADTAAGDVIENIYRRMTKNEPRICRMNRLSAEICKLATNCFLTTKIAFANAIGDLATVAGAEPEKILRAIGADSRIGEKYLGYGFGFGGPCFPRDNRALGFFADSVGYDLQLSKATDQSNNAHLDFMFGKFRENHANGKPIVFDYVTYKPGVNILEESQPLALAVLLARAGKRVKIRETKAVIDEVKKNYGDLFIYEERN